VRGGIEWGRSGRRARRCACGFTSRAPRVRRRGHPSARPPATWSRGGRLCQPDCHPRRKATEADEARLTPSMTSGLPSQLGRF